MAILIPRDLDPVLQKALRDLDERLERLDSARRAAILQSAAGKSENVTRSELNALSNELNNTISSLAASILAFTAIGVVRGAGSTHSSGLVPDPGASVPMVNARGQTYAPQVLHEDGTFRHPLEGLIQAVPTGKAGTSLDQRVLNVLASMAVLNSLSTETVRARNMVLTGTLTHSAFDDLRFPAQGINPTGSPAPATPDAASGLLSFSGTVDNVIAGVAQIPHAWKRGTEVHPHIHLRFPTSAAANTRWQFFYDVADVNGDWTNTSGTYTSLPAITVANPQNVNRHVYADLGDLPMSTFKESAIILWQVWRLANSDAADNDTNACLLAEFDIHLNLGKLGTPEELPV